MRKISLVVRAISAILAWSLFFFWWKKVLGSAGLNQKTVIYSLLAIAATLLAAIIYSVVWILHNKRVARRGRRGVVSFYKSPLFEKDALGRVIDFGSVDREPHRVILVRADAQAKVFIVDPLASGAAR